MAFSQCGDLAVAGSAVALPFSNASFNGVGSFGLLHHLPDDAARQAVTEMFRVCRSSGYIATFDAVLPDPAGIPQSPTCCVGRTEVGLSGAKTISRDIAARQMLRHRALYVHL